jgi:hypothetical protein
MTMVAPFVVGRLECPRRHQQRDPRLPEDILQLVGTVRRIDVDEDRADLRAGVLQHGPLGHVRRPDPDSVALDDAGVDQAERERVNLGTQLLVGPPAAGRDLDESLMLRLGRDRLVEVIADSVTEQGHVGEAAGVRRAGRRDGEVVHVSYFSNCPALSQVLALRTPTTSPLFTPGRTSSATPGACLRSGRELLHGCLVHVIRAA